MFHDQGSAPVADASVTPPALDGGPIVQARFSRDGEGITITPITNDESATGSYALCRMPKSLADELAMTCQWFWHRHKHCLGILLLLEPKHRVWTAVIPTQRCSRDSACWSANRKDVPAERASSILMGSFQSRVLSSGEEPSDCPPPHDGLHLVMSVGSEQPCIFPFLRCGIENHSVAASDVLFDDIEPVIESVLHRLTFA